MDWNIILTSSLIAIIISSLFTLLGNWLIKRLEFRNIYYKTIIDKRIKAYKDIEIMLGYFVEYDEIESYDDSENLPIITLFSRGKLKYQNKYHEINNYIKSSIWISYELTSLLKDINLILTSIYYESKKINDDELAILGLSKKDQIETLVNLIYIQIYSDLNNFYSIKRFFNKKIKGFKKEVIPEIKVVIEDEKSEANN